MKQETKILLILLLTGLLGWLLRLPHPFSWAIYGLLTASLYGLAVVFLRSRTEPFGRFAPLVLEICCLLLVAAAATFMYWRAAQGDRPISGDHPVHYFRFWYFMTQLLPGWKLYGWSNIWFAGEPVGYLYPHGGSFWAAAVYWLSLGQFSLEQAYASAVWLAYVFEGIAVYYAGKYIFGRGAGLAAALLYVTDIADYYNMGGWFMTVKTGVWPNSLSIAFSLFALVSFLRLLERGGWAQAGRFSLLAAISLLVHPLQIINIALYTGAALAAYIMVGQGKVCWTRRYQILGGIIMTAAISCLWLLPFFSAGSFAHSYAKPWAALNVMGQALYKGNLFPGMWVFCAVLGLLGALKSLFSPRAPRLLVGLLFFANLLLGADETRAFVGSIFGDAFTGRIEYQRFSTTLRPFWMLCSGWVLSIVFKPGTKSGSTVPCAFWLRFVKIFAAACLSFPLLVPFAETWYAKRRELSQLYATDMDNVQRLALVSALKQARAESSQFFRVALFDEPNQHGYYDLAVELGMPVYNIGWTPTCSYRYPLDRYDMEMLRALNVKYLLVTRGQDQAFLVRYNGLNSPFSPAGKFGEVFVYEFTDWKPERYQILDGGGTVEVKEFGDERIVLHAGEDASGRLRLPVSYFDRWKAAFNGHPVPIYTSTVGTQNETAMITVDLHPGEYVFHFTRRWPEKLGPALGLSGLLLAFLSIGFGGRLDKREST